MLGIIGAMQVEVDTLIDCMTATAQKIFGKSIYTKGQVGKDTVVVVCSGIGKVNASVVASTLIHKYNVDTIINIGVAGGVASNIKVGDIVIASSCVQFDVLVDTTNGGTLGLVDKMPNVNINCDGQLAEKLKNVIVNIDRDVWVGVIATSDRFVTDKAVLESIAILYNPFAVDMESGAIAQVCALYNIPFSSIRTISDGADSLANIDFATNMKATAIQSCNIIKQYLLI